MSECWIPLFGPNYLNIYKVCKVWIIHFYQDSTQGLSQQLFIGGNKVDKDVQNFEDNGGNVIIGTPGRLEVITLSSDWSVLLILASDWLGSADGQDSGRHNGEQQVCDGPQEPGDADPGRGGQTAQPWLWVRSQHYPWLLSQAATNWPLLSHSNIRGNRRLKT